MSAPNRITTRSKNATQHPGLLIPKPTRRTKDEVAAARQAKDDIKKTKELTKAAAIKRVAEFEKKQANVDTVGGTPRVVTKPKALVRTRSYANVLSGEEAVASSDVDMADNDAGSAFEPRTEEKDETTDDNAESTVILSPPRKKKRVEKKAPKPKVRDAIKAVQVEKPQEKQMVISDDDGVVDVDPTPKPRKALPKARKVAPITGSDDDRPIAAPKLSNWDLPDLTDNDESDVAPPKGREGAKGGAKGGAKMGGKGKEKATDSRAPRKDSKGSNQNHDRKNVPTKPKKSVLSHDILIPTCRCLHWIKQPCSITFSATPPPRRNLKTFPLGLTVGLPPSQRTPNLSRTRSLLLSPANPIMCRNTRAPFPL